MRKSRRVVSVSLVAILFAVTFTTPREGVAGRFRTRIDFAASWIIVEYLLGGSVSPPYSDTSQYPPLDELLGLLTGSTDVCSSLRGKLLSDTERKAKRGDVTAQYELGLMYECGFGVAKDVVEALAWYIVAAGQDEANRTGAKRAARRLAHCMPSEQMRAAQKAADEYREPHVMPLRRVELLPMCSLEWRPRRVSVGDILDGSSSAMREARVQEQLEKAKSGDASAQYKLGVMYECGIDVTKDVVQALAWYMVSTAQCGANKIGGTSAGARLIQCMTPDQINASQESAYGYWRDVEERSRQ